MFFCVCVFFLLIWVLWPFQEYFAYIKPIFHQRWVKTGEPGEKPHDHLQAELGFPTCDPSEARTTADSQRSQLSYPLGYGGLWKHVLGIH